MSINWKWNWKKGIFASFLLMTYVSNIKEMKKTQKIDWNRLNISHFRFHSILSLSIKSMKCPYQDNLFWELWVKDDYNFLSFFIEYMKKFSVWFHSNNCIEKIRFYPQRFGNKNFLFQLKFARFSLCSRIFHWARFQHLTKLWLKSIAFSFFNNNKKWVKIELFECIFVCDFRIKIFSFSWWIKISFN